MSNTLIYFGHEKPLSNLMTYNMFDKLIPSNALKLLNNMNSEKYQSISNKIDFQSSWSSTDKEIFYNHLLVNNFFNSRNRPLNIFLINQLFGPFKLISPSFFIQSLKFFLRLINQINFKSIYKSCSGNAEVLVDELRKNRRIYSDDSQFFSKVLDQNRVSKVLIISTLADPSIFDLVKVCKNLSIPSYLVPDCWDNISTAYGIPESFTKMLLWSEQQKRDMLKFYPSTRTKLEIIGSYRINLKQSVEEYTNWFESAKWREFTFLYLEGYFFENRINSINSLITAINKIRELAGVKIKIIYRPYPLKKQTLGDRVQSVRLIFDRLLNQENIDFKISSNTSLSQDLINSDVIISELSTAGLEAGFKGIPVFFIYSSTSLKRLDSKRSLKFTYLKDLHRFFQVINLEDKDSINLFSQNLQKIFNLKHRTAYNPELINRKFNELKFLAEPMNLDKWSKIFE